MVGMSAGSDPDDRPEAPADDAPPVPPLTRLAERFRIPLGVLVAVIGVGLAIVFAMRPVSENGATRDLFTQGAGVALWVCVAAVGVTWAIGLSRKISNGFALAGVLCYVVFWVSGL